ncbi:MAG: polyphosphate kinase [Porticoccaceae bacterium]|nr:polyphosphate kinase [Porticoccaceae bacterium]
MKLQEIKSLETPYVGVTDQEYQLEKHRLQVELLKIQQRIIKDQQRLIIVFEGRDAAGKGSAIKRFTENLMPTHFQINALGIPSESESKYWFKRYEKHFPRLGQIGFFDRSWYSRALIEPTMGYCSETRYKSFMNRVLNWEHRHMDNGLLLTKFYLSIDKEAQLYRFEDRLNNPLAYWKFSENDLNARKKWAVFTDYKEQMFNHTSSDRSPWVVINANQKKEARLTCMLYLVRAFGRLNFESLTREDTRVTHTIRLGGVKFRGLTLQQLAVLKELKAQEKRYVDLD